MKLCQMSAWEILAVSSQNGADLGADAAAFQAVALLVPVPFLQACNRRGSN
jgi:hypothetical protein